VQQIKCYKIKAILPFLSLALDVDFFFGWLSFPTPDLGAAKENIEY